MDVQPPLTPTPTPSPTPTLAPGPVAPVPERGRLPAIDVLRGVAVLGIFMVNIVSMALPFEGMFNPARAGWPEGSTLDELAWWLMHVPFEMKMHALFSALFGAGLMLMSQRWSARGRAGPTDAPGLTPRGTYYRRVWVLLGIGLVHAYVIWFGDILVYYALIGLALWPARRLPVWAMLTLAAALLAFESLLLLGFNAMLAMKGQSPFAQADLDAERLAMTGNDWWAYWQHNAGMALEGQVFLLFFFGWRLAALMLLGMAAVRTGVLTGARPPGFYRLGAAAGVGLGLPLAAALAWLWRSHDFQPGGWSSAAMPLHNFVSVLLAFGYLCAVVWFVQAGPRGLWARLCGALAAVGRMALTNYLTQSLVALALFPGVTGGLWDRLSRADLLLIVAGLWLLQLIASPLWLRHFRFGPAEWLWRSATYGRWQPLRRRDAEADAAG